MSLESSMASLPDLQPYDSPQKAGEPISLLPCLPG